MSMDEPIIRFSNEDIIELIREHRDEMIAALLKEPALRKFLFRQYKLADLSAKKTEFIRKALQELATRPVDLVHYAALILDIRKKEGSMISATWDFLFHQDIDRAIRNYL